MAGCNMMFVIQLDRPAIGQPWQALRAAAAFDASLGKYFIAVDSDIDPDSLESIIWAMAFSTQPHRDAEIIRGKVPGLDPSVPLSSDMDDPDGQGASAMLINACPEHPYLPVSLLRQDFMEKARERWAELSLPALNLSDPWHGYPLSDWTGENADEAEKAVTGRYLETGEKLVQRREPTSD